MIYWILDFSFSVDDNDERAPHQEKQTNFRPGRHDTCIALLLERK